MNLKISPLLQLLEELFQGPHNEKMTTAFRALISRRDRLSFTFKVTEYDIYCASPGRYDHKSAIILLVAPIQPCCSKNEERSDRII